MTSRCDPSCTGYGPRMVAVNGLEASETGETGTMTDIIESLTIADTAIQGLSYRVDITPDYDSEPSDNEGITPKQWAAWRADEWRYVGVIVTPIIKGTDLEFAEASLWGVECGTFTNTTEDDEVTGTTDITTKTLANTYPGPDLVIESRALLVEALAPLVAALETVRAQLTASA